MAEGGTERRLAAIVQADVVGYSRLMGADEAGTLDTMKAHRRELWGPLTEAHGGRIVGTAGDAILMEFASAVAAVECSVAVQLGMIERNIGVPDEQQMLLRVGVNIGEVIFDDDDIFGDGVNLAARLQEIADPGGVAISGKVHEEVADKLEMVFADDGEHTVKNIVRPVHVWRWSPKATATTGDAAAAGQPLALPEKPSIAVLPFENISGDPEQEYFADGITEDIITALSRVHLFFVIARNSSFVFKGQSIDVREVGRQLGVEYVLEGSLRKAGNRIRVTAQFIDASNGNHIWAERYDRELDDIFAIQDEITQHICGALEGALSMEELRRVRLRPPENLDAWSAYHLGLLRMIEANQSQDSASAAKLFAEARTHSERAEALDPSFARPLSLQAMIIRREVVQAIRAGPDVAGLVDQAIGLCDRAGALDPQDGMHNVVRGLLLAMRGDWHAALRSIEAGITLNPNSAFAYLERGLVKSFGLWPESAVADLELAARLSPLDPLLGMRYPAGSYALLRLKRYEDALEWAEKGVAELRSLPWPALHAAVASVALGRVERAKGFISEARRRHPGASIAMYDATTAYFADEEFKAWHSDRLREAGLSEE
ncbi:MAG: adenylate/guanylate cyclase domain-containing protein [Alphaproteobacteria bacterium]|jgi:adenylate cyclase|nr:adenylate/guanylate cyclase domain-containing protein [Alphaproteobacteria bacterium]